MRDMPFTAGRAEAFRQGQQAGLNRALTQTFGEDATALTPEILGRAKDRIGGVFRDVSNRNALQLDNTFDDALRAVRDTNTKAGPLASSKVDDVAQWLSD